MNFFMEIDNEAFENDPKYLPDLIRSLAQSIESKTNRLSCYGTLIDTKNEVIGSWSVYEGGY